jgi:hypothetical protein
VYLSIDELQTDLDLWVREYNEQRPHQGRWCFGKTPMQTFLDAMLGEIDRSLITSDKKTDRSTRHQLSDQVTANTAKFLVLAQVEEWPKEVEGGHASRRLCGVHWCEFGSASLAQRAANES